MGNHKNSIEFPGDENAEILEIAEEEETPAAIPPERGPSKRIHFNPFVNSIFPVLLLDKNMKITFANRACENLFTGFFYLEGRYFIDIFGASFEIEDVRNIRNAVTRGANGYSWKGMARMKSRDMVTIETRVYLFIADMNIKNPSEFVVIFDDVTLENRRLLRSVFMSLLEASKLKDNDTGKHITRVNFYSRRIAEEFFKGSGNARVDADFIDNIGFLASMHDVGKIGTPDDILNKEGPLSKWEWTIMQEHTKNGAFILSTYPNPMAKDIALSHHEKWNGTGYPFQLEGDMIPLSAQIVSIADVYDALRMERSYKPPFPHTATVEKIMEGRGIQFNPLLLDVFYPIAADFNAHYEENRDKKHD